MTELKEEIKEILETYACDICSKYSGVPWIGNGIDKHELNLVVEIIMKAINDRPLMESLK